MHDGWRSKERESEKVGFSINFSKTKIMTNISQFKEIRVCKNVIEVVSGYKYLGQTMSLENWTKNELKIRRANAWKAFWAQSKIMRGKMNLKSKIKILESTVYPTLTYGAQTWTCIATQIQKVTTTQHAMLRIITGTWLKDKIHISELYNITKTKNLANFIGKLKPHQWPYKFNKPQWPYHGLLDRFFFLRHFTPKRQWPYRSPRDRVFLNPVCGTVVWSLTFRVQNVFEKKWKNPFCKTVVLWSLVEQVKKTWLIKKWPGLSDSDDLVASGLKYAGHVIRGPKHN